jgi:hypothetical protein
LGGTAHGSPCNPYDLARPVVAYGYECPVGLGIYSFTRYDVTGDRRRMIFMHYTDYTQPPELQRTLYVQIVRGRATKRADADDLRYPIDICIYSENGSISAPIIHQIGGDKSMSICCHPSSDDDDEEVSGAACPVVPPDFPMPAPLRDVEPTVDDAEQAALHSLLTVLQEQLPWRTKWRWERAAVMNLMDPNRESVKAALFAYDPNDPPDDFSGLTATEPNAGYIIYPDGTYVPAPILTEPPPPSQLIPQIARVHVQSRTFRSPRPQVHDGPLNDVFQHIIAVFAGRVGTFSGGYGSYCPLKHCFHGATWAFKRKAGEQPKEVFYKCNHGRCPWEIGMSWFCEFASSYNRDHHVHLKTCGTSYDPTSVLYGHNCNDDTTMEYASVRLNYHWGNKFAGYPCLDSSAHWYPDLCW